MENSEHYQNLLKAWTGSLAPANYVEQSIVTHIAQLDYLISLSLTYGLRSNNLKVLSAQRRYQAATAKSISYNLRTLELVRKMKLTADAPPVPPKQPAKAKGKAKGKVIPFPKAVSTASVGRPAKVRFELDSVPDIAPCNDRQKRIVEPRERRWALDLKLAS